MLLCSLTLISSRKLQGRAGTNDHKRRTDSVREPDVLKMVMEGIDGQVQPPEWIQTKDIVMWTDVSNAGHHSLTLLPICVTERTAGVQSCCAV